MRGDVSHSVQCSYSDVNISLDCNEILFIVTQHRAHPGTSTLHLALNIRGDVWIESALTPSHVTCHTQPEELRPGISPLTRVWSSVWPAPAPVHC